MRVYERPGMCEFLVAKWRLFLWETKLKSVVVVVVVVEVIAF